MPSSRAAKPSRAACGSRVSDLGELRLQRREPGEDRLDGGVLLGIEPGELLGDLREGVLGRLQCRDLARQPGLGGRICGLCRRKPLHKPVERGFRVLCRQRALQHREPRQRAVDLGNPRLDRRQPPQHRLHARVLLGVEPGQLLGDLPERGAAGGGILEGGEAGLQRSTHVIEPPREPLGQRRGILRRLRLLEPRHAFHRRLGEGVLLGVQSREPFGQHRHRALARGLEGGEADLERRRVRDLARTHLVEPRLEPLEQRARLGRLAHLLEHPHALAQLVEPGEGGLQRGVLVADQPDELARHRLQPLLGRPPRCERVEPGGKIGLCRGERCDLRSGAHPRRPGGAGSPMPPHAAHHAEHHHQHGAEPGQDRPAADTQGIHVAAPPCTCRSPTRGPRKRPQSSGESG